MILLNQGAFVSQHWGVLVKSLQLYIPQKCFTYTYGLRTREHHRFLPLKRNISHTIRPAAILPVCLENHLDIASCFQKESGKQTVSFQSMDQHAVLLHILWERLCPLLSGDPVPRSVMGFLPHCWDPAGKGSHLLPRLVLLESLMLTDRCM